MYETKDILDTFLVKKASYQTLGWYNLMMVNEHQPEERPEFKSSLCHLTVP